MLSYLIFGFVLGFIIPFVAGRFGKIIPADPLKVFFGNSLINYYNSDNIGYYLNGILSFSLRL